MNTLGMVDQQVELIHRFVHEATNMLVDARISLFVIYPGLKVFSTRGISVSAMDANADIGNSDPFAGTSTLACL